MADLGCRLKKLIVTHSDAATIDALIGRKIDCDLLSIQTGAEVSLCAEIITPSGIKVLR